MENSQTSIQSSKNHLDELKIWQVLLLVLIPPALLMIAYLGLGHVAVVQNAIPALLLFFLLAVLILFPIELYVVLRASKVDFGRYSLQSAFTIYQKLPWWQIALFGVLTWGFAGLMTVTIMPLETSLFAPLSESLSTALPAYFDWTDFSYLERYSRPTLILTAVVLMIFNGFVGPVIEELFFRGYLTAKINRYGAMAPVIITVLFSLYHFWLPFDNLFRIAAFLPAFYLAWRKKNIYIAIVCHVLSNLFSTINIIMMITSVP